LQKGWLPLLIVLGWLVCVATSQFVCTPVHTQTPLLSSRKHTTTDEETTRMSSTSKKDKMDEDLLAKVNAEIPRQTKLAKVKYFSFLSSLFFFLSLLSVLLTRCNYTGRKIG
jgi:hypothetical protein